MKQSGNRLVDIARLAGVSIGTVDRVIHNRGRVSDAARQKVNEAISTLDYKPNILARSLRLKSSVRIGVVVPDFGEDEYWRLSINGINSELGKWSHYGVNIFTHTYDPYHPESFRDCLLNLEETSFDGVLIAPVFHELTRNFLLGLRDQNIPFVLFDSNLPELAPLSFAGQDLYASGRLAAELMLTATPRDGGMALIHITEDLVVAPHLKEKERGFFSFIAESGHQAHVYPLNPNLEGFRTALSDILSDPNLTGVFITNSWGTSEVGKSLQQSGRQDLVLVGYDLLADNIRLLRSSTVRFLINQNPGRMARTALNHLFTHLVLGQEVPAISLFPLDVVTRENVDSYLQFPS